MTVTVNGVECEYERTVVGDAAGETLLFLHGWGGNILSFKHAYTAMSDMGLDCVNFAFPSVVPSDWGVYDYAALVTAFLKSVDIEKPIVIGHSFGGRIAMILAAQGVAEKIALVDSAGLKPRPSLNKKLRIAAYRRAKKCGKPLDGYGSIDYNNLGSDMRKVFVRIVNTHLDGLLPYIKCDTLIFWGKRDRDTPMYMAKRLRRGIKTSKLVTVDGGHYSYVDASYKFVQQLKSFVTE